jgi:hypothetical protein
MKKYKIQSEADFDKTDTWTETFLYSGFTTREAIDMVVYVDRNLTSYQAYLQIMAQYSKLAQYLEGSK